MISVRSSTDVIQVGSLVTILIISRDLIQMLLVGLLHFLCKQNVQNLCTDVKTRFSSFEYNLQGRRDVHQPILLQKITLKLRDCSQVPQPTCS